MCPDDADPLTARTGLTPAQRRLRAQLAANARWARRDDRAAAMAPALAGQLRKFEREVDPHSELAPNERRKRAENARKAHMQRMSLKSAQVRRRGAKRRGEGGAA